MNEKIRKESVTKLFEAILSLKDVEECYVFFEDICTINELLSLSQRFEVAGMLSEGKTYLEIADKTGASTATISRVNRSLNYGNDGYDMVFKRINK
ncbi:MAG: TrpR YerC/YecD [Lachnospiraceae bacterium]|nr:TrpR YerC/YecD [Lachnospiraceae bacterium]